MRSIFSAILVIIYINVVVVIVLPVGGNDVFSCAISSCPTLTTLSDGSGRACLRPPFSSTRNGTRSLVTSRLLTASPRGRRRGLTPTNHSRESFWPTSSVKDNRVYHRHYNGKTREKLGENDDVIRDALCCGLRLPLNCNTARRPPRNSRATPIRRT